MPTSQQKKATNKRLPTSQQEIANNKKLPTRSCHQANKKLPTRQQEIATNKKPPTSQQEIANKKTGQQEIANKPTKPTTQQNNKTIEVPKYLWEKTCNRKRLTRRHRCLRSVAVQHFRQPLWRINHHPGLLGARLITDWNTYRV